MAGDIEFSANQLRAINTRGADLLVSAAAGSGKTAVLVERVIRMLTADEPLSVDRLLIVTFTEAAAKEMKNRIYTALSQLIRDGHEHTAHLKRQLMLLGVASISTIHSLCLQIIRQNFQIAGVDPGFKTILEPELAIVKAQICQAVFEEQHALEYRRQLLNAFISEDEKSLRGYMLEFGVSDTDELYTRAFGDCTYKEAAVELSEKGHIEGFWCLLDAFSRKIRDDVVQGIVVELYDKLSAQPDPEGWLDNNNGLYCIEGVYESAWYKSLKRGAGQAAELIISGLSGLSCVDEFVYSYREALACLENNDYQGFTEKVLSLDFSAASKAVKDKEQKAALKNAGKQHERFCAEYAAKPAAELFADIEACAGQAAALRELIKRFGRAFAEYKSQRNLLDFADYEHLCLKIISSPESTSALEGLRRRYDEIFIDEYQDTSGVQELILQAISRPDRNNLFMVGDLKQSIYKFRLASPELFRAKYRDFSRDTSAPYQKVDLSENFRSRKNVIDSINFVFRRLMSEEVGELDYDENAELRYGADYYDSAAVEAASLATELYIIDKKLESGGDYSDSEGTGDTDDALSELSGAELEARLVATRIKELVTSRCQVFEAKGKTRDIRYSDIAILMRSVKSTAPAYIRELSKLNIESFSQDSGGGYFTEIEISLMLAFLSIIDNPYQDIELVSVLYSPVYGFTPDELTELRLAAPKAPFFDALLEYRENGKNKALTVRLDAFISDLNGYREKTRYLSVHEIVWELMHGSGFYDYAAAMPGGAQRRANLDRLYDAAFDYEKTGLSGYFNFVKYFRALRDKADADGARLISEGGDAVRIMTIHKSKGLEFPVVFVCGLAKRFNETDLNKNVLLHQELGIAMNYTDLDRRVQCSTLIRDEIRRRLKAEQWSEEMRCLYVALTRAKEKLILVGTIDGYGSTDIRVAAKTVTGAVHPAELLARRSYLAWLLPCFYDESENDENFWEAAAPSSIEIENGAHWRLFRVSRASIGTGEISPAVKKEAAEPDDTMFAELKATLDFVYSGKTTALPAKLSVTEVKRLSDGMAEEEGVDSADGIEGARLYGRSRFLDEDNRITGAQKGSVIHFVMERLDLAYRYDEAEINGFIATLVQKGALDEKEAAVVNSAMLARFFNSPLAERIRRAEKVYKEKRFVAGLRPEEINEAWAGDSEPVLINGMIDCYFIEKGEIVLIDYKTDHVRPGGAAELAERYAPQLRLYKKALEINTELRVKESWLFLFDSGETVRVE